MLKSLTECEIVHKKKRHQYRPKAMKTLKTFTRGRD